MTAEENRRATRRYMQRQVGDPTSDICTLCGRRRVKLGLLVACRKCDAAALLNSEEGL